MHGKFKVNVPDEGQLLVPGSIPAAPSSVPLCGSWEMPVPIQMKAIEFYSRKDRAVEKVKRCYKKNALVYHPDKNSSPSAETIFKQLNQAYRLLLNGEDGNPSLMEQYFSL